MSRKVHLGLGLVLLSGAGLVAASAAGVVSPSSRGGLEGRSSSNASGSGGGGDGAKPAKFRKQTVAAPTTQATAGSGNNQQQPQQPPPPQPGDGRRKKPLQQPKYRTLQRLLQDLEESDYAGIGAWGSFSTNPRRRVSRSFNGNSEGGPDQPQQQQQQQQQPTQQQQQQQQSQQQPPQQQQSRQQGGLVPPQPQQQPPPQQSALTPQQQQQLQQASTTVLPQPGVTAEAAEFYDYTPQQQAQMEGYWGSSIDPNVPVSFYRDGGQHHQQLVTYHNTGDALIDEGDFDRSHIISLRSVLKIGVMLLVAMAMSYMAVVPRTAPTQVYNYLFKMNMLMLTTAFAPVLLLMGLMYNPREINVNNMVHMFFSSFTWGYVVCFITEVISATGIKLALFKWLDGGIFEANPEIPVIYLPWVWKDQISQIYRPKLVTLLSSDVLVNCIASPIIEEGMKLLLFRTCSRKIQRRRQHQQQQQQANRYRGVVNDDDNNHHRPSCVHSIIVHMVVVALGLKVADNNRRILLYTKPEHASKPFFAFARGVFPVHELCGAFTALNLVRRDMLGEHMPVWRLLAPAVVLHSMANFRGMKPIFKWASSAPWTEMQLQALSAPDYATALQQIWKAGWGLVWFAVLARVLGYLLYSHYVLSKLLLVRRQHHHHQQQQQQRHGFQP